MFFGHVTKKTKGRTKIQRTNENEREAMKKNTD